MPKRRSRNRSEAPSESSAHPLRPGDTIPGFRGVIPTPEEVAKVLDEIAKTPQTPGEAERVYQDVIAEWGSNNPS